jgi:hypothetical protein
MIENAIPWNDMAGPMVKVIIVCHRPVGHQCLSGRELVTGRVPLDFEVMAVSFVFRCFDEFL